MPRVHVINGTLDEGLLGEVFSNQGLGTLIYANEYEHIRPAMKKDVRAIQLLTKQGVEADELVKRTKSMIEKSLSDYFIFEIDKNPVACVALHVYPEAEPGRAGVPVRQHIAREPGHRAQAHSVRGEPGARTGVETNCSRSRRRPSRIFSPKAASSKALQTFYRLRAVSSTTRAAAIPRCW